MIEPIKQAGLIASLLFTPQQDVLQTVNNVTTHTPTTSAIEMTNAPVKRTAKLNTKSLVGISVVVGDYTIKYLNDTDIAITKINMGAPYNANNTAYTNIIPETINGYTVTEIGDENNRTILQTHGIDNITIPKTVKKINTRAFASDSSRTSTSTNIHADFSNIEHIGDNAFYLCRFDTVTLNSNQKYVGNGAFLRSSIRKLSIGNNYNLNGITQQNNTLVVGGSIDTVETDETIHNINFKLAGKESGRSDMSIGNVILKSDISNIDSYFISNAVIGSIENYKPIENIKNSAFYYVTFNKFKMSNIKNTNGSFYSIQMDEPFILDSTIIQNPYNEFSSSSFKKDVTLTDSVNVNNYLFSSSYFAENFINQSNQFDKPILNSANISGDLIIENEIVDIQTNANGDAFGNSLGRSNATNVVFEHPEGIKNLNGLNGSSEYPVIIKQPIVITNDKPIQLNKMNYIKAPSITVNAPKVDMMNYGALFNMDVDTFEINSLDTKMGAYVFSNSKIKNLIINSPIDKLHMFAFKNSKMDNVELNGHIAGISRNAFYNVRSLRNGTGPIDSFKITKGVDDIGETGIQYNGTEDYYISNRSAIPPSKIVEINQPKNIGASALTGYADTKTNESGFKKITLTGDDIRFVNTSDSQNTIVVDNDLNSQITINGQINRIGVKTFKVAQPDNSTDSVLPSLTINGDIETVYKNAFNKGFKNIAINGRIEELKPSAFEGIDYDTFTIRDGVGIIGAKAFANNALKKTTDQVVTNEQKKPFPMSYLKNTTYIGDDAFYNNVYKGKVTVPENVGYLGSRAFAHNFISYVKIPDRIKEIKVGLFENNPVADLQMAYDVRKIGDNAFKNHELACVSISRNVELLGVDAFKPKDNTLLTKVFGVETLGHADLFKDAPNVEFKENTVWDNDCMDYHWALKIKAVDLDDESNVFLEKTEEKPAPGTRTITAPVVKGYTPLKTSKTRTVNITADDPSPVVLFEYERNAEYEPPKEPEPTPEPEPEPTPDPPVDNENGDGNGDGGTTTPPTEKPPVDNGNGNEGENGNNGGTTTPPTEKPPVDNGENNNGGTITPPVDNGNGGSGNGNNGGTTTPPVEKPPVDNGNNNNGGTTTPPVDNGNGGNGNENNGGTTTPPIEKPPVDNGDGDNENNGNNNNGGTTTPPTEKPPVDNGGTDGGNGNNGSDSGTNKPPVTEKPSKPPVTDGNGSNDTNDQNQTKPPVTNNTDGSQGNLNNGNASGNQSKPPYATNQNTTIHIENKPNLYEQLENDQVVTKHKSSKNNETNRTFLGNTLPQTGASYSQAFTYIGIGLLLVGIGILVWRKRHAAN